MILPGAWKYWSNPDNCLELDNSWKALGLTPILAAVQAEIEMIPASQRKSILELGCGSGRVLQILTDFKTYTGIDQSPNMLSLVGEVPDCHFVVYDLDDCPITKADLVLCIEVLQHHADPLASLALIRSRYHFKHLVVTLMVGDKSQEFGLKDGIGSIAVAHSDALESTDGALVTFVDQDPLSTLIVHYENKPPAKRRQA